MTFLTMLLTSSLIMSIIMMLLLGFSLVSRTAITAGARYVMWIILLVGLVIPFRPILGKGLITVTDPWQATTEASVTYLDNTAEGSEQPNVESETVPAPEPKQDTSILNSLSAAQIVFVVWAIGAIVLFGKYMIEYYKFQRIIKRWGVPVTDEITLETFEWTKARMGLEDKKIHLITCNTISTPMLTGLFKPTILLPDKDIGDEEMELILEHELTHYKHKDLLINLLGITALCVHWFNPIVYFCLPAIYGDGESYCDEAVLKNKDKDYRRFYGEVIISMIETSPAKPIALSTCFYAKKLSIKRRLYNIMETNKNMKKLSAASIATVLTLTMISGSVIVFANPARKAKSNTVGAEKAKSIALKDAGLKAEQVNFVRVRLTMDDGARVYDVEFYSNGMEYDYEIDAKTGAIREKDKDIENYSIPNNSNTNQKPSQKGNQASGLEQNSNKKIAGTVGVSKAKEIALKDAGLKSNQVSFVKAKLESDDGVAVYDVEFYSNGVEYDYEIDAKTGAIREKDKDIENYSIPKKNSNANNTSNQNLSNNESSNKNTSSANTAKESITLAQAKDIALKNAGLKSAQVTFVKSKMDTDNGVKVYDVEFYSNGVEYDYEIDAITGAIREKDKDIENYTIPKKSTSTNRKNDNDKDDDLDDNDSEIDNDSDDDDKDDD